MAYKTTSWSSSLSRISLKGSTTPFPYSALLNYRSFMVASTSKLPQNRFWELRKEQFFRGRIPYQRSQWSTTQLLHAKTLHLGTAPVFVPEASALHRGIIFATQLNINNLLIEGDNLLVINAIKGIQNSMANSIIQDIQIVLEQFQSWQISHVHRKLTERLIGLLMLVNL